MILHMHLRPTDLPVLLLICEQRPATCSKVVHMVSWCHHRYGSLGCRYGTVPCRLHGVPPSPSPHTRFFSTTYFFVLARAAAAAAATLF